ncbi:hypothetical protein CR513_61446, partial [Mucuna pruriens]
MGLLCDLCESDHPEIVGSIGGYQYGKQSYQSRPYDSQQFGRQQYRPSPSQGQYPAQKFRSTQGALKVESKIPGTTVPTIATTESAIIGQLTIFRGSHEAISDKQLGVLTYYELQQHAILTKFKFHDPRPQNSARSGNLPSQIIPNPKGDASVVSLRSGRELPETAPQQKPKPVDICPVAIPKRTLSARKAETGKDLLKMFWKVEINIPLLDVIKQIPKYANFLKELCVHKRKKMKGGVELGGILLPDYITLPKKCQDPRIFPIPCTIGECTFINAMLDLGASVNVMPTSIYKSLNFGDLEPTGMTIQLANRSIVQPLGVLEDVLVQVNELIFPIDFYVLDMEDETSEKGSTLILGRPFLMTARTKIDVHVETLLMEYNDNLMQFNIFEAMRHPTKNPSLFGINVIDELVVEYMELEVDSAEFSNFAEDIDSNYDELLEVQDLSDSKDDIADLANLDLNSKLIYLIDQVCKYNEEPKCLECARVQVAETKRRLQAQVATILTTVYDSVNQGRDPTWAGSNSDNKMDVKSDLSIQLSAESNSNSINWKSRKQLKAKTDSANQVPNPDRVGQLKPRPANEASPLHSPLIELKPLLGHLKYTYLGNDH